MISEENRAERLAELICDIQEEALDYAQAKNDNDSMACQKNKFRFLVRASFKYFKEIQKIRRAGREGRK